MRSLTSHSHRFSAPHLFPAHEAKNDNMHSDASTSSTMMTTLRTGRPVAMYIRQRRCMPAFSFPFAPNRPSKCVQHLYLTSSQTSKTTDVRIRKYTSIGRYPTMGSSFADPLSNMPHGGVSSYRRIFAYSNTPHH